MSMSIKILTLLTLSLTAHLAKAEQPSSKTPSDFPYPERVFSSLPEVQKKSCSDSMEQWEQNALKNEIEEMKEAARRDVYVLLSALQTAVCVAGKCNASEIASHIVNTVGTYPLLISASYCFLWASVCELNRQSANTGKKASEAEYKKDEANYLFLLTQEQQSSTSS